MSRLFFLGTGAALPSAERGNTALAVEGPSAGQWLQVDCGGDSYRALCHAGIAPDAVPDLLITHAHIDHIGGLPSLIESWRLAGRTAHLRIWALPEVLAVVQHLFELYSYELTLSSWSFTISQHTLEDGQQQALAGISTRVARMDHALPSVGMRLELPRGPVCYSCDTQPTPALPQLARDVSLLITECTFLQRDVQWARRSRHMTAMETGQQATTSGAHALALVHLGVADGWKAEEAHAEASGTFNGPVLIPNDGDEIAV